MEFSIPYGKAQLRLRIPDNADVQVIMPVATPPLGDPAAEIAGALDSALAAHPLPSGDTVTVVISDGTRPVPNSLILPVLLRRLESSGFRRDRIQIMVGTGLHRPTREDELPRLLGPDVYGLYRVEVHDARDLSRLVRAGTTSRGTPVVLNRLYVESDVRVLTGMIEPHQFVGFTGGAKSAFIGLSGEETIAGNHALLRDPRSRLGVYDGNPARMEMEEVLSMVPAHLAVNVILNNEKQVAAVLAGPPSETQRSGVALSARLSQVTVPHLFDVVVASPGGYPKDLEVYQAQKAVAHAAAAVREGGTIVLVAECPEGAGDDRFERFMAAASTPLEVMDRFSRSGFRMGDHKAFLLARSMVKAKVLLVSDRLPADLGKKLMFEQYARLEDAMEVALSRHGPGASIAVMPKASSTIPRTIDS